MSKIVLFLMSKSIDSLVLLESNVKKLKSLVIELKKENSIISKNLNLKEETLLKQANDLKEWKEKYKSLKIANTFLGSNDKSLTKLKINKMIKELDKCIMNLTS
ncbi:MAG: hypothetical protein HOH98_08090 [Flavobacteriaceae bacterium]|nr:hypothetical protein [Flavobacteriaceae bacterium]MBT6447229.1 hypothetical protein [Flavobacteriaceae bacterium]MDG1830397.1 hypothetical protein [Flavobacteriaceae bacterium]